MGEAPTLPLVIGRNVRRLREEAGMRQQELATKAREYGFEWTGATIAAIETARRGLSSEELLTLPLILGAELAELLQGSGKTRINDRRALWLETLRGVSLGRVRRMQESESRPLFAANFPEIGEDTIIAMKSTGLPDEARIAEWIWDVSTQEAERKAARVLGISPSEVAALAYRAWNSSLTEERERRVAELDTANQEIRAVRGHVTRKLLAEIRDLREGLDPTEDWRPRRIPPEANASYWRRMARVSVRDALGVIEELEEYGSKRRGEEQ
jgi:transcriptional regulator with XRE-family HTH domain